MNRQPPRGKINVLYWGASLVPALLALLAGAVAVLNTAPDGPFIATIIAGRFRGDRLAGRPRSPLAGGTLAALTSL
jgi:hypothetical protein